MTHTYVTPRAATVDELEKLNTKQLMEIRQSCYKCGVPEDDEPFNSFVGRVSKGYEPNPKFDPTKKENRSNNRQRKVTERVSFMLQDVLFELNRRPHVPNKAENKLARKEKAKAQKA